MATKAKKRRCKGTTKAGKRCKAAPLKDSDTCLAHADEETRETAGFGGPQEGAGRPRLPRPHEVLRERIEADIDRWLAPLEAALSSGKPVQMWDGDERKHHIEFVADPALGMKALQIALDRVYGKPRQQIELSGEDGGPVRVESAFGDPKLREELHDLVRRVADARADESGGTGSGG